MAQVLPIPIHRGDAFSWLGKTGSTCISDLQGWNLMSRVWTDACDEGFYVQSHRTGAVKLFVMTETVHRAGDLECWVFKSDDGVELRVYND
jgi:hypothetical protein